MPANPFQFILEKAIDRTQGPEEPIAFFLHDLFLQVTVREHAVVHRMQFRAQTLS